MQPELCHAAGVVSCSRSCVMQPELCHAAGVVSCSSLYCALSTLYCVLNRLAILTKTRLKIRVDPWLASPSSVAWPSALAPQPLQIHSVPSQQQN